MNQPSKEQLQVIHAPLAPISVVACAGSGKTFTAVHRLVKMRQMLGAHRSRVALLSFSNVAVDSFRQEYQNLVRDTGAGVAHDRVLIDTLDGYITSNVLRPHAYRTMGAQQAAFLVTGGEAFLAGFRFKTDSYPREIQTMQVGIDNDGYYFCYSNNDRIQRLNIEYATTLVNRLGRVGAYTHNLGRYWCYRTLLEQPNILRALARRYSHILIDEAQDIGTVHQAIIELLIRSGCQVSLIGDPNQGIYEFAGANGAFLKQYCQREDVNYLGLTKNFRSVPDVLDLANRLSTRADTADRGTPHTAQGIFFVPYRNSERKNLITAFQESTLAADLELGQSAVLCRGRQTADNLAGKVGATGQGIVKLLAQAAILRDQRQDFPDAFKLVAIGIVGLLADPPKGLVARITQATRYPDDRALRRLIWAYTRNRDSGLPAATLIGDSQWHSLLLDRTRSLLEIIAHEFGLESVNKLPTRLSRRGLPNTPLIDDVDLAVNEVHPIRVDTVHQAKGESLDAVLYIANREQVNALLAGVNTEVGRIGYVALTRARNLFWLGVPKSSLVELRPMLLEHRFQELGAINPK